MKFTINFVAFLSIILLGSSFTLPTVDIGQWVKLGSKKVSYKLDRDVLKVGYEDGAFTKLKVKVTGGNINMHKMIVEYGNGTKEEIKLKHYFRKNGDSRMIDLKGNNRVIKDITFWYDSKNTSKRRATIHVLGKH